MQARSIGLAFAGVTALAAVALIGWSAYTSLSAQSSAPPASSLEEIPRNEAPPIEGTPEDVADIVDAAQSGRVLSVDPDDTERVARIFVYDQLDSAPGGRVSIVTPRGWFFLDDGDVVVVDAAAASLLQPPGAEEPESGRLTGDVTIRYFPAERAQFAYAVRDDPKRERMTPEDFPEPLALVRADSFSFDTALGEISTSDEVTIDSERLRARFVGLRMNLDETNGRLAFLRTERDGEIVFHPRASGADSSSSDESRAAGPTAASGAESAESAVGERVHYRAEFEGGLTLTSAERTVASDALTLWARLIDDALPPDAIATAGSAESAVEGNERQTASSSSGDAAEGEADGADVVRLQWSGPLVVRPLDTEPQELEDEHLFARFTSPQRGAVTLRDDGANAQASCAALDYAFTSARVALAGRGDAGVVLSLPDQGEVLAGRFDLDLTTGYGTMPGPGSLRAAPSGPDPFADPLQTPAPRDVAWREGCDLFFVTRDGWIDDNAEPMLREAIFRGAVLAREAGVNVRGQYVRTLFDTAPRGDLVVRRIIIEGDAEADAAEEGRLTAERLEVAFRRENGGQVAAVDGEASGRVRAQREGSTLAAEFAETTLVRDESGELAIDSFAAQGGAVITRPDGVEAFADSIRTEEGVAIADLIGQPALVRYEGGSITGGSMRFLTEERALTVFGPGVFNYSEPRAGGLGYERVQIEWEDSLEYDDRAGLAVFEGDCLATADPEELASDVARAHRITLRLTPSAADATDNDTDSEETDGAPRLLSATVEGWGELEEDGAPATVESRRFDPDASAPTGVRLRRIVFLEGQTIIADAETDELRVPVGGRLLFEDRRPVGEDEADTTRSLRGTTLFEWAGRMRMDRAARSTEMRDLVRMRQRPLGSSRVTVLECERLDAELFAEPPDASAQSDDAPIVKRAEALGAVYAAQEGRQLIADRLLYDGATGIAEAHADERNLVTLFDRAHPTAVNGRILRWNLRDDRLTWLDAGETTAPR